MYYIHGNFRRLSLKERKECMEHIFEDVDCENDSSCCKTHLSNSPKRHNSKDSTKSDNSNISNK